MPSVQTKIEGRGNGITTILLNLSDIADALNRPPELILKYLGFALGCHVHFVSPSKLGEKSYLRGLHSVMNIQHTINQFIDVCVLCIRCHLPETDLIVSKGIVKQRCNACGFKEPMKESKLTSAILKMVETA